MTTSNVNNEHVDVSAESQSDARTEENVNSPVQLSESNVPTAQNGEPMIKQMLKIVGKQVKKCVVLFGQFCFQNAKLLLGSMASGSLLGLFFAVFISAVVTPILFFEFNCHFPDYDTYFKPLNESVLQSVNGENKVQYIIKREAIPPKQLNNDSEFVYLVSSSKVSASSNKPKEELLYTVSIREVRTTPKNNSSDETRRLALNVCPTKAGTSTKVASQTVVESSSVTSKSENKTSAEQKQTDATLVDTMLTEGAIPWYETSNIALSNSIFEVSSKMGILKYPSYPTSITAFISWVKEHGKKKLELNNMSENDNQTVASALERILENDWKFQKKSGLSLLFARSVNGSIQFLCVLLFNAILILLCARYIVVLYFNPLHNRFTKKNREENTLADSQACEKRICEYANEWGMEAPTLALWRSALSCKKNGTNISLAEITNQINQTMQSSFAYVSFMADTIPALGFVGTIIGIGKTMLNTSAVISNELGKQQSRISDVSLDLAFAFDTTLVALLLSMVIGFFITVEMYHENKNILNTAEDIINQDNNPVA